MDSLPELSIPQKELVSLPPDEKIFLKGPAGSGKTTAGVARMFQLIDSGVPAEKILLLFPQRTLAEPYQAALNQADLPPGGMPEILTLGGLAQRMVTLFWPFVAASSGFSTPIRHPAFLTMETAQYFLADRIQPLIERGYFGSLTINRSRLYTQILDSLNKAALTGIPVSEISTRLKSAWTGESAQLRVFDQEQECLLIFRKFCLENHLLDFSLQVELFFQQLWHRLLPQSYLFATYPYLIYDNAEEDFPAAHDLIQEWLPELKSALIILDSDAGYRGFLGADPQDAERLRDSCTQKIEWGESERTNPSLLNFAIQAGRVLNRRTLPPEPNPEASLHPLPDYLEVGSRRFYPQLLDWTAERIATLSREHNVPLREIVVLSPFMNDLMRHSLVERLEDLDIPAVTHRPSRSLRDEPVCRCLLALAKLAHPQWNLVPPRQDVAVMLSQAISGLDPVRAWLLTEMLYRRQEESWHLLPFDQIIPAMQERVSFVVGNRYNELVKWLNDYRAGDPVELDLFFSRLFEQVLTRSGFGFYQNIQAGIQTANLVESMQKFRQVVEFEEGEADQSPGKAFIQMVEEGILAAQYLRGWQNLTTDAVLLVPATTFVMLNRPVDYQFWLNAGDPAWLGQMSQPLTQPYVLSRQWEVGAGWTDDVEQDVNQEWLFRLLLGLVRRCRKKVFIGLSELDEQGYHQDGMLLTVLIRYLRHLPPELRGVPGGGLDGA